MVRISRSVFLCLLMGLVFLTGILPFRVPAFDLVLLLDESGSMKTTDPGNARVRAAELFTRICRPTDRVGLMGFATNVREMSALEPMGPGPARDALETRFQMVRSDGQWTDIEQALRLALRNLTLTGDRSKPRAVLLLTDGRVDLAPGGKDTAANSASEQRIRGALVSDFIQENIQIYCVAFSRGADRNLLNYLAEATRGLCVQGDKDSELERLFLRLFEEIAQPQTIPVHDGKVKIDTSVREATFLVTHGKTGTPVTVTDPNAHPFSRDTASQGMAWYSGTTYDIVTVTNPQPGTWSIAPLVASQNSRVMVLTDLELQVKDLPAFLAPGDPLNVQAFLQSEGQMVATPEILRNLVVTGRLTGRSSETFPMRDDGASQDEGADDGLYGGTTPLPSDSGFYDVEIVASGPTFERRILKKVSVLNRWFSVDVENATLPSGQLAALKVRISDLEAIEKSGAKVAFEAVVQRPDQIRQNLTVDPVTPSLFSVAFTDTTQPGEYRVTVTGRMTNAGGTTRDVTVGPLAIHVTEAAPPPAVPTSPPVVAAPTVVSPPAPEKTTTPRSSLPWEIWVVVGILLAVVGTLMVMLFRRRPAPEPVQSMEQLRKRALEIREESDTAATAAVSAERSNRAMTETPQAADIESVAHRRKIPPPPTGVEIIPEPEIKPPLPEEAQDQQVLVATEPAEAAEESGAMSQEESDLLAEILGESADLETKIGLPEIAVTASPQAPQPASPVQPASPQPPALNEAQSSLLADIMEEVAPDMVEETKAQKLPSLTDEESDLLADIMGEIGDLMQQGAPPAPPNQPVSPPPPPPTPPSALSEEESALLADIVGDLEDLEAPPPAVPPPPPAVAASPSSQSQTLSDAENDLLADILGEEEFPEKSLKTTPNIPDEKDKRSDQEIIDDILRDIEGLVE
ncbi:MAG TPA: VWA domain-containing protein [Candidatus Sumerlaeota bacterium]|nr:VWA domain-containing protein [Candidatus Sumerlaeota bacterium]